MTTPTIETAEDAAKLQAAEGSKTRLNNREKHQLSLLLRMIADAAERDEEGILFSDSIHHRVQDEMKRRGFRIHRVVRSCEFACSSWNEVYWGEVNASEQRTLDREAEDARERAERETKFKADEIALRSPKAPEPPEDHSLPSGKAVLAFFGVATVIVTLGTLLAAFITWLSK
jgi:hypothetical protein